MRSCPQPVVHAVNCLLEVKSSTFGVKARECCHCYSQPVLANPSVFMFTVSRLVSWNSLQHYINAESDRLEKSV